MRLLVVSALWVVFGLNSAYGQSSASSNGASTPAAAAPQIVAPNNQDKEWRPTPEQRERAVHDVLAYLAAKDAHRFKDAYALFTPNQKASVPFGTWEADMQAVYAQAGAAEGRTLRLVTWYKNPVNAPPGVYAVVDFSSRFAELSLHCGFVAMQQQLDGSFGVSREEENSISKREIARLTPEVLQRVRAQYGC